MAGEISRQPQSESVPAVNPSEGLVETNRDLQGVADIISRAIDFGFREIAERKLCALSFRDQLEHAIKREMRCEFLTAYGVETSGVEIQRLLNDLRRPAAKIAIRFCGVKALEFAGGDFGGDVGRLREFIMSRSARNLRDCAGKAI